MLDAFLISSLLFFPFVQLVISISRYIVGLKFSSQQLIVTLTYVFIFASYQNSNQSVIKGVAFGLFPTLVIIGCYILTYRAISKLFIHYFAKQTIIVSIMVSMVLLSLNLVGLSLEHWIFQLVALILAAIAGVEVVSLYIRLGKKRVVGNIVSTLSIALVSFLLFSIDPFRNLLFENQYLIFVPTILSIFVGRYRGLRISEYIRFFPILNKESDRK